MKFLSSMFAAPAILAIVPFVAGCSSDSPAPTNAAGSGAGGSSGSLGSSGSPATFAFAGAGGLGPKFASVTDIIAATCFGSSCHNYEGNPLQMKIDDKLYATLTTHVTENCGKLVNTSSPADSALVKVLLGDCGTAPKITPRMPEDKCFQGDVDMDLCVSTAKVDAIRQWIAMGAKP